MNVCLLIELTVYTCIQGSNRIKVSGEGVGFEYSCIFSLTMCLIYANLKL